MGKKSAESNDEPKGKTKKVKEVDAKLSGTKSGASTGVQKYSNKDYERALKKLHVEVVKLQQWVQKRDSRSA